MVIPFYLLQKQYQKTKRKWLRNQRKKKEEKKKKKAKNFVSLKKKNFTILTLSMHSSHLFFFCFISYICHKQIFQTKAMMNNNNFAEETASAKLRAEGNKKFQAAINTSGNSLKRVRFNAAFQDYKNAVKEANKNSRDSALAWRNIATCHGKILETFGDEIYAECTLDIKDPVTFDIASALKECIVGYHNAVSIGKDLSDQSFIDETNSRCYKLVEGLIEALKRKLSIDSQRRLFMLEELVQSLTHTCLYTTKVYSFSELSDLLFHKAISTFDRDECEYARCLAILGSCDPYINIAMDSCKYIETDDPLFDSLYRKVDDLHKSIFLQRCSCESIQACENGDRLFQQSIMNEENFNPEAARGALDNYRQAIVLAREQDVELEAIALSKMGSAYKRVLKNDNQAKTYFTRCIALANSLVPRILTNKDWFVEATDAIQCYQQKQEKEIEEVLKKSRQHLLEGMKDVVNALDLTMNVSLKNFITHVYTKHPPKNSSHVIPDFKAFQDDKSLIKCVIKHYHPDKIAFDENNEDEMKWVILCEEISKVLNRKMAELKEVS